MKQKHFFVEDDVEAELWLRLASKSFCKHDLEARVRQSKRMKKTWAERKKKRLVKKCRV